MNATIATPPAFAGSIPFDYDRYLGPFLFEPYADDLTARLDVPAGGSLLELACGTGILTERVSRDSGAADVVATDVSEAMLACARERRGALTGVQYRQADACELPFEDARFDGVCSQFGLMFFSDKQRALNEAHRVLKPGGQLVFNVWDDHASNPYVRAAQDAIARFFAQDPPTFLEQPWGYSALEPLRYLVDHAGFTGAELHVVEHVSENCSPREVASGLVLGNPTITEIHARSEVPAGEVVDTVAAVLAQRFGSSPCRVPKRAIVMTARKP